MGTIHPSAIISPKAILEDNVTVGPFCVIEEGVHVQAGTTLEYHVILKSGTTLGKNNYVYPQAILGGGAQHIKLSDKRGSLRIGDNNTIRENVTIHLGLGENDKTVIGDNNLFMVGAHIGHDSIIGSHCIFVNNTMIAGHVKVEDHAYIAGGAGIHQFCRVGQHAMVGAMAKLVQDAPPYVMIDGVTNKIVGLNLVGLRRKGFTRDELTDLKSAYRIIYRKNLRWEEIIETLKREFPEGPVTEMVKFLSGGNRGFLRERRPQNQSLKVTPRPSHDTPLRKVG
ncbi:MAG: acyl-ACP--UDP-N-acetylglucosamine O-acyltransferase [Pirellulaceae bacterium]|nr:acyl-ACP--UDP-N-acetylglucosamine O-acyltransferase [Pirellulaceae bacterium]